MEKKIDYPVQMADIRINHWRVNGSSSSNLKIREAILWRKIKRMADTANIPSQILDGVADSRLLGYGWEWAVYSVNDSSELLKVPRDIFIEVNDPVYLSNTEYVYNTLREYVGTYIVKSRFKRNKFVNKELNTIYQDKLFSSLHKIVIDDLPFDLKRQFVEIGTGLLKLLDDISWLPDLSLEKDVDGNWKIRNIKLDKEGNLKIFDFSTYYDVFRLYPQRMEKEVAIKGNAWKFFLEELEK